MMKFYKRGEMTGLEPFGGRIEEFPFPQSHDPSLGLPLLSIGASPWGGVCVCSFYKLGFGFWNIDFNFIFNELIYEKCLGYCLTEAKQ